MHLDPALNHGPWTDEEIALIYSTQQKIGNKWAKIAKLLPGRTDNAIKNYYYSNLRKGRRNEVRETGNAAILVRVPVDESAPRAAATKTSEEPTPRPFLATSSSSHQHQPGLPPACPPGAWAPYSYHSYQWTNPPLTRPPIQYAAMPSQLTDFPFGPFGPAAGIRAEAASGTIMRPRLP